MILNDTINYFNKSMIVDDRSSGGISFGGIAYIVGLAHDLRLKETKF